MPIWRRSKPDALLHHSDRGSQYTCEQFQRLVADNGVVLDEPINTAMESFFSGRSPDLHSTTAKSISRSHGFWDAGFDVRLG